MRLPQKKSGFSSLSTSPMKTIFNELGLFREHGMAGKKLPKMKASVKNSNVNTNTNSNNIAKFQKAALLPTQAKAVKGGSNDAIIVEEILIG